MVAVILGINQLMVEQEEVRLEVQAFLEDKVEPLQEAMCGALRVGLERNRVVALRVAGMD